MSILNTISKQFFGNVFRGSSIKFNQFRYLSSDSNGKDYGDLINDDVTSSFLLPLNSEMAEVKYEKKNGTLHLTHTNVPDSYQGLGVGNVIAKEVFNYCLKRNLKVKLSCEFLQNFYEKNPEYKDLVVG